MTAEFEYAARLGLPARVVSPTDTFPPISRRRSVSPGIKKLLFVDTNIWLDFYRPAKSEAILKRLAHLESVKDRIISTHLVEMEFKNNRQRVIIQTYNDLSAPNKVVTQGILADAKATRAIEKNLKSVKDRVNKLKRRLVRIMSDPVHQDPVYQACQRILCREHDLVLGINDKERWQIRRKAFRRFYLGCPPRKGSDISIGDAYNWEWMIACADKHKAELVILTRDSDYGHELDGKLYLNDHLRVEFAERVSKKRKVHLCRTISAALRVLGVQVPREEAAEEDAAAKGAGMRMIVPSAGLVTSFVDGSASRFVVGNTPLNVLALGTSLLDTANTPSNPDPLTQ